MPEERRNSREFLLAFFRRRRTATRAAMEAPPRPRSVAAPWARLALLPVEAHISVARAARDAGPFTSPLDAHCYLRLVDALGRIARRRLSGDDAFGPRSDAIARARLQFGEPCRWDSVLLPKVAQKAACYLCASKVGDYTPFDISPMSVLTTRRRMLLGTRPACISDLICYRTRVVATQVWLVPSGARTQRKVLAIRDDPRDFSELESVPISIEADRLDALLRECDRTLEGWPMVSAYWLRTLLEIDSRLFARRFDAIALPPGIERIICGKGDSFRCLCPACDLLANPAQCVRRRIDDYAKSLRRNHAARVEAAFRYTFDSLPRPLPADIFELVWASLEMRLDSMLEEIRPLNHRMSYW